MKSGSFLAFFVSLVLIWYCNISRLKAEESITAYFSNDSVNGLVISDAYETHNMGITYKSNNNFLSLDLGIVSPDMHRYKNKYRVANRSFGELVTLSFGSKNEPRDNYEHKYFINIRSTGQFGIDEMQDFMHGILGLRPVNEVNDPVRMPNKTWVGFGGEVRFEAPKNKLLSEFGAYYYLGTDRAELSPYLVKTVELNNYNFIGDLGLKSIFFDEVVTAEPIIADYRSLIPYAEFGVTFEYLGFEWFFKDRFSLPTIKSDDSLYGVLSAGISYRL